MRGEKKWLGIVKHRRKDGREKEGRNEKKERKREGK